MDPEIAEITRQLQCHGQRATYDAVATLLDRETRNFMDGEERNHQNSWVVSAGNGLPKRYGQHEIDPALLSAREARNVVIDNSHDLRTWLDRHLEVPD